MRRREPRMAAGRRNSRSGMVEFGILFDPAMAEDIRRYALAQRVSFTEAVRTLCQWGLEELEGGA